MSTDWVSPGVVRSAMPPLYLRRAVSNRATGSGMRLQVHDVDRGGVQRALDGALEGAGRPRHVARRGDRRALLQRGRVGGGEPHRQLGGDLDVDQPGDAALAEEGPLAARLPDHRVVDDGARLDGLERVDLHPGGDVRLGLDHALVADDGALLDPRAPHDVGVLADHAAAQRGALADEHPVVHHRAVDEGALLDHHVGADHAVLAQVRAGLDLRVLADADRPGEHRVRVDLGPFRRPRRPATARTRRCRPRPCG